VIEVIKSYLQRLKGTVRDLKTYVKFASRGNVVEHITNFAKPNLKLVLLLHGFGTTRRSVSILEKRLRDDGFDVFSINLGGFLGRLNTGGIDELAMMVKDKIASLADRYNLGKLAIIGHSKGGLVGRYYITMLNGNEHVHTLITLGAPHQGNWWAILAALTVVGLVSKSLWQMMPHSRFMKRLKKTPIPADVYTVSICSDTDGVVSPNLAKIDIPEGSTNIKNVELHGYSHTDYLIKRGVYEVIRQELRAYLRTNSDV